MVRILKALALAAGVLACPAAALAQAYPVKPVRIIVPLAPGQGTDVLTRFLAQRLQESLGQPFVIENKPGAGGNIGADAAARATPDGYTLLMGTNATHAANVAMYASLTFDHVRDFAPLALVGMLPMVLSAAPGFPVSSVAELIAAARAKPGEINVALPSTTAQIVLELFAQTAGAKLFPVSYKGSTAAFTDVAGGRVPLLIDTATASLPQIGAGKLRPIAISTAKRTSLAPGIPTFAEAGLAGFELVAWNALFAPRGTPAPIVQRLNAEVLRILAQPDTRERMLQMGIEPAPSTPEQLAAFVDSETRKWGSLIRSAGLKAQ